MQLSKTCNSILDQLTEIVRQIEEKDFVQPCPSLGSVFLGQHLRHTLEYFLCLEKGFERGIVDYDGRNHDRDMVKRKQLVLMTIAQIREFVDHHVENKPLVIRVGYDRNNDRAISIESNYFRELAFTIEHAVHHMALMKVGLHEAAPYVVIPSDFGVAVSTLRHRELEYAAR